MKTSYNPNGNQLFTFDLIKSFQELTDAEIKKSIFLSKKVFGNILSFEGDNYIIEKLLKNPKECCIAFTMKYFFKNGELIAVDQNSGDESKQYFYGCILRLKNFLLNNIDYYNYPHQARY